MPSMSCRSNRLLVDTANSISTGIHGSNKRLAVFKEQQKAVAASGTSFPALATNSATRWDSNVTVLESVVSNLRVLLTLKANDFAFRDSTAKTRFIKALRLVQDDEDGEKLR